MPRWPDVYVKVHGDVGSETTRVGGALTVVAMIVGVWMVAREMLTWPEYRSKINVDVTAGKMLRINLNLSFPGLDCDYVSVDVWDKIGRNVQNVTRNVEKWHLDTSGQRRLYHGRNRGQKHVATEVHAPLEELHADGIHVEPVRELDWPHLKELEFLFVTFYKSRNCLHCDDFQATWERVAEEVQDSPVTIASVDCDHVKLCQGITAFPSIRFFHYGDKSGEYHGDRTVGALTAFIQHTIESYNIQQHYPGGVVSQSAQQYPGCMVHGFLLVNRVPGNFHITARSKHHSLHATNLSHTIHHLSFGLPLAEPQRRRLQVVASLHDHAPLDGMTFHHASDHVAWHHFIHVVPARYILGWSRRDTIASYQLLPFSHLQDYDADVAPEARFAFDLSPMAVVLQRVPPKPSYDILTGLLGVIGGAFALAKFLNDLLARL